MDMGVASKRGIGSTGGTEAEIRRGLAQMDLKVERV